jgi:hypothetical protein
MRFKKSNIMINFPTDSNDIIWRAGSGSSCKRIKLKKIKTSPRHVAAMRRALPTAAGTSKDGAKMFHTK